MTYTERVAAMEAALLKANHCVTIKLTNSITDKVVVGYAFLGVFGVMPSLSNSFEIELEAPSYMELIKKVYNYSDDVLETRKFAGLFLEKRAVDVEVVNYRIHFPHKDIVHLLETPIFAKCDENTVFLNYDDTRDFEKDFQSLFKPEARTLAPKSFLAKELAQFGWFIAHNYGE